MLSASQALTAVTVASLDTLAEPMSLVQFRALVVLNAEGPLNVTALATRLGVNPSSVTRLGDRLVVTGQLDRTQNPGNRREVRLAISKKGRRNVNRVLSRRRTDLQAILDSLEPAERVAVATAFGRFALAAGEMGPHRWPTVGPLP